MRRKTQFSTAVLLTLALIFTGCSDDGGSDSDDTIGDPSSGGDGGTDDGGSSGDGIGSDDNDGSSDDNDGGNSNGSSSVGSDNNGAMSVWGLPPGEFEEFLPYQLIDDEFQ
ncbi:MAG: hypothetical protein P8J50_01495 [Acidimicrobiales bacterium]|nr:hypothetical protein [Acidimicrobiales bacterium]